MSVEIILREDVPHLGSVGDVVRVKSGYARNFLLPRGLAIEANRRNLHVREHQRRVLAVRAERQKKVAESLAEQLAALKLSVRMRVGEGGRLFGSVTNLDVERMLVERGFSVDRRKIALSEPLKELGSFSIEVQLSNGVRATLQLQIEPEL